VTDFEITHLYISPGHNFFGHEPGQPSSNPVLEVPSIWCVAGKGIEGDRFFRYKEAYKGQITFFEEETYNDLCAQFGAWDRPPPRGCFNTQSIVRSSAVFSFLWILTQPIELRCEQTLSGAA
jgi:hypothetical protein